MKYTMLSSSLKNAKAQAKDEVRCGIQRVALEFFNYESCLIRLFLFLYRLGRYERTDLPWIRKLKYVHEGVFYYKLQGVIICFLNSIPKLQQY